MKAGLGRGGVKALAIDPQTPTTIYAGTDVSGAFKSTNGGGTWRAVNTGLASRSYVRAPAIDPQKPTTVYAGTGDYDGYQPGFGVVKSTDGGRRCEP